LRVGMGDGNRVGGGRVAEAFATKSVSKRAATLLRTLLPSKHPYHGRKDGCCTRIPRYPLTVLLFEHAPLREKGAAPLLGARVQRLPPNEGRN
jgi:hypothetical protein